VQFVDSFNVVQQLATVPPSELLQSYLVQSWPASLSSPPPCKGPYAVALLRLIVQAQHEAAQSALLEAFPKLPADDRNVLGTEMAYSGVANEGYSLTPDARGGPAVLIYYSPAFLQHLADENGHVALLVLADVYRAARALYPLESSAEAEARTVTVHVGAIKGQSAAALASVHAKGGCWRVVRKSATDAIVEQVDLSSLSRQLSSSDSTPPPFEVLPIWPSHWIERGAVLPWHSEDVDVKPEPPAITPMAKALNQADVQPRPTSLTDAFQKRMAAPERDWRRARDMQEVGWVIDPQKSRWIGRWDLSMLVPLVFTAIVTPYARDLT
jgi:hypothetical protein